MNPHEWMSSGLGKDDAVPLSKAPEGRPDDGEPGGRVLIGGVMVETDGGLMSDDELANRPGMRADLSDDTVRFAELVNATRYTVLPPTY